VTRQLLKLTLTWAFLMALAGGEFVVSGMQMEIANRPVVLFFAGVMIFTVGMVFMHLNTAPVVAKGFAVAGVFWLVVLFGLGSADLLSRNWYPVQHYNPY
jgi:cytochrome c oxidase subunit IV